MTEDLKRHKNEKFEASQNILERETKRPFFTDLNQITKYIHKKVKE